MKMFLVRVMRFLHLAITVFVLIGCFLPRSFLLAHVIFTVGMMIQWQLNSGTCILTNFENALLGANRPRPEQQGQFIKSLLSLCFTDMPPDKRIKQGLYSILMFVLAISIARLLLTR